MDFSYLLFKNNRHLFKTVDILKEFVKEIMISLCYTTILERNYFFNANFGHKIIKRIFERIFI